MHKRCGFLLCLSACNQRFGVVVLLSFTDSGYTVLPALLSHPDGKVLRDLHASFIADHRSESIGSGGSRGEGKIGLFGKALYRGPFVLALFFAAQRILLFADTALGSGIDLYTCADIETVLYLLIGVGRTVTETHKQPQHDKKRHIRDNAHS